MKYRIEFKKSAIKTLKKLPKSDQILIIKKINSLSKNPRLEGSQKLVNADYYRIRSGSLRVIYEICDDKFIIIILLIDHRKDMVLS